MIMAVCGGSPMDCAKGIGVVLGDSRHFFNYTGVDNGPNPGPPLVFIPTTAGTLDLFHGECNVILLEKVVQYNYKGYRKNMTVWAG